MQYLALIGLFVQVVERSCLFVFWAFFPILLENQSILDLHPYVIFQAGESFQLHLIPVFCCCFLKKRCISINNRKPRRNELLCKMHTEGRIDI